MNTETLAYVEKSGEALEVAKEMAEKLAATQEKVAQQSPVLIEAMVNAGLLDPSEKAAAVEKLSSHDGCLEVTANLLQHMGETKHAYEQKLAAIGNGQSVSPTTKSASVVKDASADLEDGGFVGRRRGAGEMAGSDRVLLERLGITG